MMALLGSCQGYTFPHAEVFHTFPGVLFTVHIAQVKWLSSSLASWIVRIYMGAEVHYDNECMPVLALIERARVIIGRKQREREAEAVVCR